MTTIRFIIAMLIVGKLLFVSQPVRAEPQPQQSDDSNEDQEKEDAEKDEETEDESEEEAEEDLRLAVNTTTNDGNGALVKNDPEVVTKNDQRLWQMKRGSSQE